MLFASTHAGNKLQLTMSTTILRSLELSDEITLVFPAARPKAGEEIEEATTEEEKKKLERRKELDPQSLLPYSGRLQKVIKKHVVNLLD